MKVIIAGSRTVTDYGIVDMAVLIARREKGFDITEIVSGGAKGVDSLGELLARENQIPVKLFLAEWGKYGKRAGYLRNTQMANYADALIAVWDYRSPGTRHMIHQMEGKGKPVYIHDARLKAA